MFLSFGNLALLCAGVVLVWLWTDGLRARDVANAAAMAACERIGLQFLDGTAAFASLRFARVDGRMRLRRTYVFDYTSQSIERRQGFAILLGMEVEYVGFAPEHTAQANTATPIDVQPEPARRNVQVIDQNIDVTNNVLDLSEHRARRSAAENKSDVTPKRDQLN